MKMSVHESASPEQTRALAAALGRRLTGGVVALTGTLGSGKTCFVKGLAEGLGLDAEEVSSPTFTICRRHEGPRYALVHVDAYRLAGGPELESIGWDEMLAAPATVIAVEWADRVAEALPPGRLEVHLEHTGPTARRITVVEPAPCPTCGRSVGAGGEHSPFCSRRCRLVDLGRWMKGDYRISRGIDQDSDPESR